jgi:hypothetical protein
MTEKLCIFCSHFDLDLGSSGYSEYTPGNSASCSCDKGKFKYDEDDYFDYREVIQQAKSCIFYVYYKDERGQ